MVGWAVLGLSWCVLTFTWCCLAFQSHPGIQNVIGSHAKVCLFPSYPWSCDWPLQCYWVLLGEINVYHISDCIPGLSFSHHEKHPQNF